MNFYKASQEIDKPFITWDLWAKSEEQLIAMEENENPLILPENEVPQNQFGVCPMKIDEGVLVLRDEVEMQGYEIEYNQRKTLITAAKRANIIKAAEFVYGAHSYPMHNAAQMRYNAVAASPKGIDMMTVNGDIVNISSGNLPGFLDAYYNKIIEVTNYTIE